MQVKHLATAALALMLFGCAEKPLAQVARLAGVNDIVKVDRYIFSTSTDRDELRVLDLAPSSVQGRQFKVAPNPLEALSIPVVARPAMLAKDLRYVPHTFDGVTSDNGEQITFLMPDGSRPVIASGGSQTIAGYDEESGPYVYAASAGGIEISVVDATNDPLEVDGGVDVRADSNLREVKRLLAPAPVTAMSALRVSDAESLLVYATWDGRRAQLVSVSLPPRGQIVALEDDAVKLRTRVLDSITGEVISSVLLLSDHSVALATRTARGAGGRSFILDTQTLVTRPLDFGGPVRALTTHPATYQWVGVQEVAVYAPQSRIFGVLNEEACGNASCGGIVAVDTATGQRAKDQGNQPMMTLTVGDALVQSVSVSPWMKLGLANSENRITPRDFPLLGVATTSASTMVFFDALALTQIDFEEKKPELTDHRLEFPPDTEHPNGSIADYLEGPVVSTADPSRAPFFGDGATKTETIFVANQAGVLGLTGLPTTAADGNRFPVPAAYASRALVGDTIVIIGADGPCGEVEVTAVLADALEVAQVPAACQGRTSFGVRAGAGVKPFVVAGTQTGYLGRTAPGDTFSYTGSYYRRTDDFAAGAPQLRLTMGPANFPQIPRDARWVLELADRYAPYVATVDSSQVGCASSLPGTPIFDNVRQRLFVAYASANGIVEIDPQVAYRGALSRNVYCYR